MNGLDQSTYLRIRAIGYGVLCLYSALPLVLTGEASSLAVIGISALGVALSVIRCRNCALYALGFDLVAAVAIAWLGRPIFGVLIALLATGVGTLLLSGRGHAAGMVAGWVSTFVVAWAGMDRLGIVPIGFGPNRNGLARLLSAAAAASVIVAAALATRRAQISLSEAERGRAELDRRLRRLTAASALPIALTDAEGKVLEANQAFADLLGYSIDGVVGSRDMDHTRPGDFAIGPDLIADHSGVRREEKRYVHSSGRHVFTEVTAIAEGPASRPSGWLIQVKDLSELRKAKAEATASQLETEALFERIPVALYRSLPSGEVIAGNKALADLLGYDSVTALISSVAAASAGYARSEDRETWKQLIDTKGTLVGFEQEMIRGDGSRLIVSDSSTVIRGPDGEVQYYEGALVDVTAKAAAQRSQRRLSEVLSATSDLVVITDEHGTIQYANDALTEFGAFDDNPVGDNILSLLPQGQAHVIADLVAAAAVEGRVAGEIDVVTRRGRQATLSLVVQLHRVEGESRPYFSGVGRDVTDERQSARRLQELIESKDEFIASVSHELRTPLTAAVGIAFELRDNFDAFGRGETMELVSLMAEQTQEVANLVEDLLVAARIDTDSVSFVEEEVDLLAAAEGALKTVSYGDARYVSIEGSASAVADSRRVKQILRNLLSNAARYGGPNTKVSIAQRNGHAIVEVCDDGPGIEPDEQHRIFEPYQTAHGSSTQPSSVGLGLTVSRWLARRMGGDLSYRFDGKSVFSLTLPR